MSRKCIFICNDWTFCLPSDTVIHNFLLIGNYVHCLSVDYFVLRLLCHQNREQKVLQLLLEDRSTVTRLSSNFKYLFTSFLYPSQTKIINLSIYSFFLSPFLIRIGILNSTLLNSWLVSLNSRWPLIIHFIICLFMISENLFPFCISWNNLQAVWWIHWRISIYVGMLPEIVL